MISDNHPQRSCEGYVFTRVCDSVHGCGGCAIPACIAGAIPACIAGAIPAYLAEGVGGGVCSWGGRSAHGGSASRGSAPGGWRPPPESRRLLLRTVRILLVCILV